MQFCYRTKSFLRTVVLLSCLVHRIDGLLLHTNPNLLVARYPPPCRKRSHRRTPPEAASNCLVNDGGGGIHRLPAASSSLAGEEPSATEDGLATTGIWKRLNPNQRKLWLLAVLACGSVPLSRLARTVAPIDWTWKMVAKLAGLVCVAAAIRSNAQTRNRQAVDPTSEWKRYARHPGARGRAIGAIMAKQVCFLVAARVSRRRRSSLRNRAGKAFSNGLLKLGPLYIKLGQIVSCRPGLLGEEWVAALADLQDKVPARTGDDALELVYNALEGGKTEFDTLFEDFEATPLAAASLGQVHKAKLRRNGDAVALKVQRPFLKQIYDKDFALLTTIARFMDRISKWSKSSGRNVGGVESSWTKIFADAESILYREIDYRDEADNAARFANDFGIGIGGQPSDQATRALARNDESLPEASDWLRTPYIYKDLSNERLLVQEYVPSFKVTDNAKLDAANISTEDRIKLADDLARAYLRQFCSHFFFSTDPHPGNIGIELVPVASGQTAASSSEGGSGEALHRPRLVMYDFGQASTLTRDQADGILEIIEAIIDTDVERSIEAFQKMGVLVDDADLDQVRKKVAENYRTGKIKANRKKLRSRGYKFRDEDDDNSNDSSTADAAATPGGKSDNVNDAQVMSYFTLPAEYAFVARAISQMDGVGKSLDPEFDFISSAAPYIVEIKGTDLYLKDEASKVFRSFRERIDAFFDWLVNQLKGLWQTTR